MLFNMLMNSVVDVAKIYDATWKPSHLITNSSLSIDNLTLTENTSQRFRVLANKAPSYDKSYWELTVTLASQGDVWLGMAPIGSDYTNPLNGPAGAYWRSEGQYERNGVFNSGGVSFEYGNNLTLMFAYDRITRKLWAGKAGGWISGNPANDSNPWCILAGTYEAVACYTTDGRSGLNIVKANFGGSSFVYPVPNGFEPGY